MSPNIQPIRVAAFDDHPSLRETLVMLIDSQSDMACVGSFPDTRDVVKRVEATKPDVVVMDISMPGGSGIDAVKLLKAKLPDLKILMQTVFEDEDNIFESIKAGASGYILKKSGSEAILQAIRDTWAGGAPMTPIIAAKVLDMFRSKVPAEESLVEDFNLSAREKEVLTQLVKGQSYKMIADTLSISPHTVDAHIRKIYEKLHVRSMTEAVSKAIHKRIV